MCTKYVNNRYLSGPFLFDVKVFPKTTNTMKDKLFVTLIFCV